LHQTRALRSRGFYTPFPGCPFSTIRLGVDETYSERSQPRTPQTCGRSQSGIQTSPGESVRDQVTSARVPRFQTPIVIASPGGIKRPPKKKYRPCEESQSEDASQAFCRASMTDAMPIRSAVRNKNIGIPASCDAAEGRRNWCHAARPPPAAGTTRKGDEPAWQNEWRHRIAAARPGRWCRHDQPHRHDFGSGFGHFAQVRLS
jgi:hypothetical protein